MTSFECFFQNGREESRPEKGKTVEIKVKLTDIVRPGDTIMVPERFF